MKSLLPASNFRVIISHRDPVNKEGGVPPHEEQGELLKQLLHSLVLVLTRKVEDLAIVA